MKKLRIDFETYSEADIRAVGPWAYSKHPSTRVLIMAWAFDDAEPRVWLPGEELPPWYHNLGYLGQHTEFIITAWNDFFELCIWSNVLKWPCPPPKYWADTAAKAAVLALPRTLEGCGQALGLSGDAAKDKDGRRLIQIFSKPKRSAKKGNKGQLIRTYPQDLPEEFNKFIEYCKQDVIAERAIDKLLPELQPRTRELWELDREINLRGVYFDMPSVDNALANITKAKADAIRRVAARTMGVLSNISSRDQFMGYVEAIGCPLDNAQKEYLKRRADELEASGDNPDALALIRLRLEVSKSSLAKYDKLRAIVDDESRARGLLRFHGASTGRWSGNLFQPQNLPRESLDLPDLCIDLLKHRDPGIIAMFFGEALEAISLCLRGMLCAPEGSRLIVSDFSQIESRVLAWLAGDLRKLQAYRDGLDIYKVNAATAYRVKYEDVTKDQRTIGKVIELACGYQGGVGAFRQFASVYGVVIPDEDALRLIKNWRAGNPKVTSFWSGVETAAVKAVAEPGSVQTIRGVKFRVQGSGRRAFLFCYLPSGRRIAYHRPRLVEGPFDRQQVEFWGINSVTKKYCTQRTYGGKLVENITQAMAMDCMSEAMINLNAAGYPIVLTVHDEVVAEVPEGTGSIDRFNEIMEIVPTWAEGLPVGAEGYEAKRYKK